MKIVIARSPDSNREDEAISLSLAVLTPLKVLLAICVSVKLRHYLPVGSVAPLMLQQTEL